MRNYKAQAEFTTYSRGIAEDLNPNYCCHFETPYLMKTFGLRKPFIFDKQSHRFMSSMNGKATGDQPVT